MRLPVRLSITDERWFCWHCAKENMQKELISKNFFYSLYLFSLYIKRAIQF